MALANTTINGLKGDTSKISIVPFSFSFTMDTEVIKTQISSSTNAITPGTKLVVPFNSGL